MVSTCALKIFSRALNLRPLNLEGLQQQYRSLHHQKQNPCLQPSLTEWQTLRRHFLATKISMNHIV